MSDMVKHINILVRGKVQGVGYRFTCMEVAYRLKICGYIRNQRDGSVFIEAEGEQENLDQFAKWCTKGPIWARVVTCEVADGEVQGYQSFDITS
jgi:acylphosphatase